MSLSSRVAAWPALTTALALVGSLACSTQTPVFRSRDSDGGQPPIVTPTSPLDDGCRTALAGPFEPSLPVPLGLTVYADDLRARLEWDGGFASPATALAETIEGYRVCWGPTLDALAHAVLVDRRGADLRGLENGRAVVAIVQSVDARGRISAPSDPIELRATGDRVRGLRETMAFFDAFDGAEDGPLDELAWNVAYSRCNDAAVSYVYRSEQRVVSLSGNSARLPSSTESTCDRNQNALRPRAVFDFTGREGRIVFDLDGATGGRTVWHLDLHPHTADGSVDITAHLNLVPDMGFPGRFLRITENDNRISIHQVDAAGNAIHEAETYLRFDHPTKLLDPGGILRRFEVRVRSDYAAVLIDDQIVLENDQIDLDFERADVLWTHHGFDPAKIGQPWGAIHLDNFGFDGPRTAGRVHNYRSAWSLRDVIDSAGPTTRVIQIPDSLAGASELRYFFTIQTPAYRWAPTDVVLLNGEPFPLAEPASAGRSWRDGEVADGARPYSTSIALPPGLLVTGANTFEIRAENTTLHNHHVEVRFDDDAPRDFTPPSEYVTASPFPVLPRVGPSSFIHAIGDALCWDGDGVMDIDIAPDPVTEYRLTLGTVLSGVVTVFAVVDTRKPVELLGRNLGIARVELVVDGTVVASVDTAARVPAPAIGWGLARRGETLPGGVGFELDTTTLAPGPHTMWIRTYDAFGTRGRPNYGFEAPEIRGLETDYEAQIHFNVSN
jgi:hypothetical protein